MRAATSTRRIAPASRAGVSALVAAHRYREPVVREIQRRGVETEHRAAAGNRTAQAA